ncbi:hypothetical protein P175DRAFT_0500550 [Aspergillus ochraceoroseus IBT 24754]|uniref:Ribonuclease H2 subunit B n=2 Tax=Aspergillus ochraceoroseus TaxID=138278 RepID=A0A2T5LZG6_9EURO|nr:uncharacterized protein P175DRAFT_0500550 [Aspergillus ochraceoroseus IBT 24754]KKK24471.1 hypothetical protein AOCH_006001 [Aspergillus ochraceoroseus]PTU21670.1 hypothetical protein P175DRAFT_0500550 [Aspergillus ochraceoroseus IBT 24754]
MRTRASAPPSEPLESSKPTPVKPSKTFILPSSASPDARFITLPNPRTDEPTRYFFCPKLGVYEITVVTTPAQDPRSILYSFTSSSSNNGNNEGAIAKSAKLLVATPIDALFFMIPLLAPPSTSAANQGKRLFQPLDDIIDSRDDLSKHLRDILYNETFRETLLRRVDAVCDSVEAGDEKMFRFSEAKLLRELLSKAERMSSQGLPCSLEERFVKQALAMPLMSVSRNDASTNGESSTTSATVAKDEEKESESPEGKDVKETQSTIIATATATASTTSVSTPTSDSTSTSTPTSVTEQLPEQPTCPDSIVRLQRISTALTFLKNSYASPELSAKLDAMLAAPETPINFEPLHAHLKYLAGLRAEALASRSLGDFSLKRTAEDDDDVAESRAEKKRRKEEEEKKKKAGESRGVRELKKVNTTGMKKMSDFFGKATVAKKKS